MKHSKKNILEENLSEIVKNTGKFGVDKKWLLKNIHKYDLKTQDKYGQNFLMCILTNNKVEEKSFAPKDSLKNKIENLAMTSSEIINIIDLFDLTQQNIYGWNALMYIAIFNKEQNLGFTKNQFLSILDKFDLTQQNKQGKNILMHIIYHNGFQNLGFTEDDIIKIIHKFDLTQKTYNNFGVYDFIMSIYDNTIGVFSKKNISILVSELDIEEKDKNNNNILIKELKNGLFFDSKKLVEKILKTENQEIIDCVYHHKEQIKWSILDLENFLKKKHKISINIKN